MNTTHRASCQLDGEYLMALPAIVALNELDIELIDALSWDEIETILGYCIDRSGRMPAGSCFNGNAGGQQSWFTELDLVIAQTEVWQ